MLIAAGRSWGLPSTHGNTASGMPFSKFGWPCCPASNKGRQRGQSTMPFEADERAFARTLSFGAQSSGGFGKNSGASTTSPDQREFANSLENNNKLG
jgi:hypothetical protein